MGSIGKDLLLYRRRFIPSETLKLRDDEILRVDDEYIVTKWRAIKPRPDFYGGTSLYCRKQGFKVSRFEDEKGNLVYWYCDIVRELPYEDGILYDDLLLDVVVFKDGSVKVVDIGEAVDACEMGLIDEATLHLALRNTERLLNIIYKGEFKSYTKIIEQYL
ncbi:MAG: DUF402 domain-containing protein [Lachnospiraceae bacterium]|nr:DUF402 domain-containing protein [Lachnospiraceae bacterium]